MTFKRGITLHGEIIQILKKYGSVIVDEESIYEISKPYLKRHNMIQMLVFLVPVSFVIGAHYRFITLPHFSFF